MRDKIIVFGVFALILGSCSYQEVNSPSADVYTPADGLVGHEVESDANCTAEIIEHNQPPDISDQQQFFQKYYIFLWDADLYDCTMGLFLAYHGASDEYWCNADGGYEANISPLVGSGSEQAFEITADSDWRITINHRYHDGWPGLISDNPNTSDDEMVIDISVLADNAVGLESNVGVLSQMPEVRTDGLCSRIIGWGHDRESAFLNYHEREGSELWAWLMNSDNAHLLNVHNPHPEIITYAPIREITGDLRENRRIQAFVFGGDVTFISRRGSISQLPAFYKDEFYFALDTTDNFEVQYVMYHERESSHLWELLMQDN